MSDVNELLCLLADCIKEQRTGNDVLASEAWNKVVEWWDQNADERGV